jgi:creatinine amidohydrolase
MYIFPDLIEKAPKFEPEKRPLKRMPSSKQFREIFPDGRMWSDPSLASREHGEALFRIAVDELVKEIEELTG